MIFDIIFKDINYKRYQVLISMVIKTETCNFSEFRVYPGRGSRFVAKDGRTSLFISRKCR